VNISYAQGDHYLSKMDGSLFTQYLALENSGVGENYLSIGAQLNLHLISFYTIESTLSVGYAHTWNTSKENFSEAFISLKLFR
jgi:hypothetical protein